MAASSVGAPYADSRSSHAKEGQPDWCVNVTRGRVVTVERFTGPDAERLARAFHAACSTPYRGATA